jgi:parallel beta-helix repeat protein
MKLLQIGLVGACMLGVSAGPALARTLRVASNGIDSGACGTSSQVQACRSISQAIANASSGDKIVVGPGLYGDIDGDGAFTTPGDEAAEVDTGCDCLIDVDKSVTITSRDGATATLLTAGGATVDRLVSISASNVVFGQKGKGFEMLGDGAAHGIEVMPAASTATVAGHVVGGFNSGIRVAGTTATLASNRLAVNTDGIRLVAGGAAVTDNTCQRNTRGISIDNAPGTNTLSKNLVNSNDNGVVVANPGAPQTISKNVISGNTASGIAVLATAPNNATVTAVANSIFGNGETTGNCGLVDQSDGTIEATGNYWGAAAGVGGNPADQVCVGVAGGTTNFGSPETREIKVKVKPQR